MANGIPLNRFFVKDGKEVVIRCAGESDLGDIFEIRRDELKEASEHGVDVTLQAENTTGIMLTLWLADFILVAEVDGKARGVIFGGNARQDVAHHSKYWISQISVAREYRRQGIGKALMEMALGLAKNVIRAKSIGLRVMEPNTAAVSLYESLGFKRVEVNIQSDYWQGQLANSMFMVKEFDKK